jgi:hypothetical protein
MDRGGDKAAQRVGGQVGDDGQAQAPRALAAQLDRRGVDRLAGIGFAPATTAFLDAADGEVVDLDGAGERVAFGRGHRSAQLVQHQPRGLIAPDAQLALQLHGRDPGVMGGHQIGGPEPHLQRRARGVHHRRRRQRGLVPAGPALPQAPLRLLTGARASAAMTREAVRPARRAQVLATRVLVGEAPLELDDAAREVGARHPANLRTDPSGANRICRRPFPGPPPLGHRSASAERRAKRHETPPLRTPSMARRAEQRARAAERRRRQRAAAARRRAQLPGTSTYPVPSARPFAARHARSRRTKANATPRSPCAGVLRHHT